MAQDLLSWTQRLILADTGADQDATRKLLGELARCETKRLRYRLLHVAGRLTRHARRLRLHLPRGWPWGKGLVLAFERLQALPAPP